MNLHLSIAGLVLLVDDPTEDVTHLIVPLTTGHHSTHQAWLVPDPTTRAVPILLDGFELDLTAIASDAAAGRPSTAGLGIISLEECAVRPGLRFPRCFFGLPNRPQNVAAHVKLRGGSLRGEMPICLRPPCGSGRETTMSVVRWMADVGDAPVDLGTLKPLDKKDNEVSTVPIGPGVTEHVWIAICNSLLAPSHPGEVYGALGRGNPAHFDAHKQFWNPPWSSRPDGCPEAARAKATFTFPTICPTALVLAEARPTSSETVPRPR